AGRHPCSRRQHHQARPCALHRGGAADLQGARGASRPRSRRQNRRGGKMRRVRAIAPRLGPLGALAAAAAATALVAPRAAEAFAQVFTRYVLDNPLIWSEEVARYLFVWVSMIGGALAVREAKHFGLDLFIRPMPRLRPVLGPLVTAVMLVFLAVLLKTGIDET